MRNTALFDQIADQIEKQPELWNQGEWEEELGCETTRCIAGWAVHFSGMFIVTESVFDDVGLNTYLGTTRDEAERVLGITPAEGAVLFFGIDDTVADAKSVARWLREVGRGRDIADKGWKGDAATA